MNGTSYLLSIDGSEESRSTSYFVWELAKQSGARVVAQHVIDTQAVWRFLSYDRAGFIGSGLYMEAREKITSALYTIAEGLMLSYTSQIDGQALDFETCIDEGDPATEIARRAQNHDMVIISNRQCDSAVDGHMFQKLAKTCPCPVLVIGNAVKRWSKMIIYVDKSMSRSDYVLALYRLPGMFGLRAEIYLDPTMPPSAAKQFEMGGWSFLLGVRSIERSSFEDTIASAPDDILFLMSSEALVGKNAQGYRDGCQKFLDKSSENGLLLWNQRSKSKGQLKLAS